MPADRDALLKAFYAASDNPSDHDGYVDFFAPDATLVMGLKTVTGREEIMATRVGMWAPMKSRHHVVSKVYPASDEEWMLFGTVDYTLNTGKALRSDWAGRMVLEGDKIAFYQVWLDASPLVVAMGKTIRADAKGDMQIV